jgi:hypothetical protein
VSTLESARLLLAFLLTAGLAASGFNRPSWARSNTTFVRYYFALLVHVLIYVGILLVCYTAFLAMQPSQSAAVWGAFILTMVVRSLPFVAHPLRSQLHAMARIPGRAREMATTLANADMEVDEGVQAQANGMLRALGIGPGSDWLPKAQPLHTQLTRAAWLFVQIREWEDKPAFKSFFVEASNEMFRLRQRFDAMSFRVSRMLTSIELLGQIKYEYAQHAPESQALDDHLRRLIGDMIADACEDISLFHRDSCVLATRGVLATQRTRRGRARAFHKLGFHQREVEAPNVYRVFPFAAALMFVGLWLIFQIVGFEKKDLGMAPMLLMIMLINLGAIAIAILPKQHYGFANGGLHRRTPWPFVFTAGLAAVAFGVCIQFLVGGITNGWWDGAFDRVAFGWPYLGFALFTATSTAWLMQDHRWPRTHKEEWRRAFDAAVFGSCWLLAAALATIVVQMNQGADLAAALPMLKFKMLASSFLLGAGLGTLVPEYARRRSGLESDPYAQKIPAWVGVPYSRESSARPAQLA